VVDAQDLSLNVSREILQQDRQIQLMRRRLVKRVLSSVKTMMTEAPEKYATFWSEFGPAVKEGLLSDAENRETLLDIASFASTHDAEKPTTLADYVDRMPEGQEHIYYMTGASRSIVESSPHLEAFRAKGLEVLILTDAIDEMWVDAGEGYRGKTFQSVAKGQVDLDKDKDADKEKDEEFGPLLTWLSENLSDSVKQVRLSSRLTTSPACLVGESGDLTPTLEKMYRAMGQPVPTVKRVLELNPEHALVTGMRSAFAEGGHETELGETAELLYGMALLAEGGELPDPAKFTKVLADRLARSL
jgi:molecular chaperone HtpG